MIPLLVAKDKKLFELKIGEEVKEPSLAYVLGENGVFLFNTNRGHEIVRPIENIHGLEKIEEKAFHNYPFIPYRIYREVLAFFRKVNNDHKSEAAVLLVLNRESDLSNQEYKIIVPEQKVGGASVDYVVDNSQLEEGEFLAGSIHSHPTFGASQSGIDHSDECNFDGVHITLGQIEKETPEIHERIVLAGETYTSKENQHKMIKTKHEDSEGSFPEEWMSKITKTVHVIPSVHDLHDWRTRKYNAAGFVHSSCESYPSRQHSSDKAVFDSMKPTHPVNQSNSKELKPIVREQDKKLLLTS